MESVKACASSSDYTSFINCVRKSKSLENKLQLNIIKQTVQMRLVT